MKLKKYGYLAGALALALSGALAGCGEKLPVVTLEKRNGEEPERIEMKYAGDATYQSGAMLFPNPTRENRFFNGWFLDEACTQSAYGYRIMEDVTFYADWTDSITVPSHVPDWRIKDYAELFTVSADAAPYGYNGGVVLTLSVTPAGDFTGEKSSDEIELQITYRWLSDEQFMGEYTSDETVAYACTRAVVLKKENNFSVENQIIIVGSNDTHGVTTNTFSNKRTTTTIDCIFYEPTLQYKHS